MYYIVIPINFDLMQMPRQQLIDRIADISGAVDYAAAAPARPVTGPCVGPQ